MLKRSIVIPVLVLGIAAGVLLTIAQQASKVRTGAAPLADRQFERDALLASVRADARAKAISAEAALLEATLGYRSHTVI